MTEVPLGVLTIVFFGIFSISMIFYYKYYKKRVLAHLVFGTMIICWSFVILFSILMGGYSVFNEIYFRFYATFGILAYLFLVYFARAFTELEVFDKRTISLAIPTFFIILLVWLFPIYPDSQGTDFTFQSFYGEQVGIPLVELITLFLWSVTIVFFVRMIMYTRDLWDKSKALGTRMILLTLAGTATFLLYSFEVTTWFSIIPYLPFLAAMAVMAFLSFIMSESWIKKVLK